MKIKFSPIFSKNKTKIYKINENTIKINEKEYFFDPNLVEYNVDEVYMIREAYRINNELFLHLRYFFNETNKNIWENSNYYINGGYRGSKFEDFTKLKNGGEIK